MSFDVVPMPLGKIIPDLTSSYNHNDEGTPDWMVVLCPNCNSDHVCCLDPEHNRDLDEPAGRWFCISCHDSWEYKRDE